MRCSSTRKPNFSKSRPMASTEGSSSRAGRNLPAAIGSGIALGIIVLLSLFTFKWLFAVVVGIVIVIAVFELSQAFATRGIRIARTPTIAATVVAIPVAYVWGATPLIVVTGAAFLAAMLWRIRRGTEGYVADTTASVFVIAYLPFMAGVAMLMLAADNGVQRIIGFILLTIANDIGGYATGVLFGKHPIAPQVSPKKSWEGLIGSLVLQCITGVAVFVWLFDAPWWQGLIVGAVLTITATGGDFVESAIKRDLGVKDMGTFLPGHGGVMDRLDSLIPNVFVSWALFAAFLGAGTS